jgi:signal transduction histidine kinase
MLDQLEAYPPATEPEIPGLRAAYPHADCDRERQQRRSASAAEEQYRGLARSLHDQLGQRLAMLRVELDALRENTRLSKAQALACVADGLADLAIDLRRAVGSLYPLTLERVGLAGALYAEIPPLLHSAGMRGTLLLHDLPELDRDQELQAYRIAQEAVTNVIKHSAARDVLLTLAEELGMAKLSIVDDGVGFDPTRASSRGFGMTSMRDRCESVGGRLSVVSAPGCGTSIEARFEIRAEPGP